MAKINFTVVRNDGFMRGSFETRYRHNERENETYGNGDIDRSREHLNVHFRKNLKPDGTQETYGETFDRLLAEKKISEKWLKPDSKLIDELVFDVNTDYFEQNGGYEYALKFYEEVYRLAVKEVGSEDYILSAVLHADERNKALSDKLGRDVYHYHLHVVYVPVVEKREYFRKKKGEPENAERKLKEVYQQISHAKKWPMRVPVERDGKTIVLNSYSLLQDRYFEHMKAAGYEGFERGERGSTAEHLDVLDYKIQQDNKRLDALEAQTAKKEKQIEKLDAKIAVKEKAKATIAEIDAMGHSLPFVPGVHYAEDESARLKKLAKKSATIQEQLDKTIAQSKRRQGELDNQIAGLQRQLADAKAECNHWYREYTDLWNEVKDFIQLIRQFPARVKELVRELFPPKVEREREPIQQPQPKKKTYDIGR
jgi:hypothetical protein